MTPGRNSISTIPDTIINYETVCKLEFVSDFIFYQVTFDLQASVDAEKNMQRDVNI